jgi:hypothetical protein
MPEIIEHCMSKVSFVSTPTYEDYVFSHKETMVKANEMIEKLKK